MDRHEYKEMQEAKFYNRTMRPVYAAYADRYGDHFLTLASSACLPVSEFHKLVSEFHKRLDRRLLGRSFYKKPWQDRTQGIMFLEQITTHIHGHAMVRFAVRKPDAELEDICRDIWRSVCPGGEVKVQRQGVTSPARYATKEFEDWKHDDLKQVVMFKDFVSQ
ncbi:hypothetical protein [Pleomorphomonas sp. NRK KF1]|uniref:hypothetical protein n=1 Tax=Pleomorphomonas sp. NRK KF1 TaxID=2943000 RepID=UPI00204385D5|nr:hypothetical protein [Pleomorphomonas sp. NRK KF1]MCM5553348.1 hypothetical protein [Pleomorphomonas sp. NRK KF1]